MAKIKSGAVWKLKIVRDDNAESPLDAEWYTFAGWHRHYKIGNTQPKRSPSAYMDDVRRTHLDDGLIELPVFMHDHGIRTYSCAQIADGWDSAQVGWIWTTQKRLLADYGQAFVQDTEKVEDALRGVVETFSAWANGDVWGFEATEYEVCPHCGESKVVNTDSCWGFIGSDEAAKANLKDHIHDAAQSLFEAAWEARS